MNITISGYNRPLYLDQTCSALSRCVGVSTARVVVLLDPCEETDESRDIASKYGYESVTLTGHAGCSIAILMSLRYGFEIMQSEFHIHLEDDCVPSRDALLWYSWARDTYRHRPEVFTVSGYQRVSNGKTNECGTRRWFTPWGWGTWADRWHQMHSQWTSGDETSWDIVVNDVIRGTRFEAYPTVSRIQNIGVERGAHVQSAEWHAKYHRAEQTADDVGDGPVRDFVEVEA